MREIIFRGKDLDFGEWKKGCYGRFGDRAFIFKCNRNLMYEQYGVRPNTIGQYTGVNDKNGTMIFEGDIVNAYLPGTLSQMAFDWGLMQVCFDQGAFGLQMRREFIPFRSFASRVEFTVVGNIYDNPELMDGGAT